MPQPQITTVIPTYRRPKMLRRAIKSVLAQTYPRFQVTVLDNASGDETPRVVEALAREDPRVKYHRHPENIGIVPNFDYGLRHVETPFFSFLSDDDLLLPHFYETAMKGLEDHPDAMFSAGVTVVTAGGDNMVGAQTTSLRPGRHDAPYGAIEMALFGAPNWTAVLFRKEAIDRLGYLVPGTITGDTELELRIALSFPFVASHRACAFHVRHTGAHFGTVRLERLWPNWGNMMRSLGRQHNVEPRVRRRLLGILTRRLARGLFLFSIYAIRTRRFDEARKAATILRDRVGRRAAGLLLQVLARTARRLPGSVRLLEGLRGLRSLVRPGVYAGGEKRTGWEGWEEAKRHLHLIGRTG